MLKRVKKNSIVSLLTAYHISDRDGGRDDDDDSEGSESYPSRTSWGAAYSLGEKYPFLFASRFGVRAYDYWWGYTSAQIDLMVSDQPLIVYKKEKKRNADGSVKHTKKEMDDLYDRWAARKAAEGSMAGKKINLSEWLRN